MARFVSILSQMGRSRTCVLLSIYWVPLASLMAFLLLAANIPIALYPAAGHDDGLFMQHAYDIATGHWLGHFSQMTLMKGPGYPLFLSFVSFFRVPVTLAQASLSALAAWTLSFATYLLFRSHLASLLIFEVLLWNFGPESNRLMRDQIYGPQLLLIWAFVLMACFATGRGHSITGATFGGLVSGWLWITREEGIANLIPVILLFVSAFCLKLIRRESLTRLYKASIVFSGCALLLPLAVASINGIKYGLFTVVDIRGSFEQALDSLQSVRPVKQVPYLPVSKETRIRIYRVSPSFAELRPFLDPAGASASPPWTDAGCGVYANTCGDYAGGWFIWALRDAAARAGKYSDASTARAFYKQVFNEVRSTCNSKALDCDFSPFPFMPRASREQWLQAVPAFEQAIEMLAFRPPPAEVAPGSLGNEEQIRNAITFFGVENHTPPPPPSPIINPRLIRDALRSKHRIISVYAATMPLLLSAGVIAYLVGAYQDARHRQVSIWLVIVSATWLAVLLRILLLVLIDISSFPAIKREYLGFAFALSCYASLLSIFVVVDRSRKNAEQLLHQHAHP